jgi:hypothetical protein
MMRHSLIPLALLTSIIFVVVRGTFADALNPDPLSVLQAAYATFNVGNVDAAMGFFTSDAELWNSRGKKVDGLEGIRGWIQSNAKANIQYYVGTKPKVNGNKILDKADYNPSYFDKLGVNPLTFGQVITIEGNKIRSYRPYVPLSEVKRVAEKCEAPAAKDMLIFNTPCAEIARRLAESTQSLIDAGEVPNE